jgi:uncharacterized protein
MPRIVLKIVPNAKRTEVVGEHGAAIKIKVKSPATDGKANAALLDFLSDELELPSRAVRIFSGEKSKDKIIEFDDLDLETARARLLKTSG